MYRRIFRYCYILFFCLLCAGCSTIHPLDVNLQGNQRLNSDSNYHSLPVVVNIYQLKNRNRFDNASFYQLWQQPRAVLGSSLVSMSSVTLNPGQSKTINLSKGDGTHYVAATAVFRTPSNVHWRVVGVVGKGIPYIPQDFTVSLVSNRIYLK